MLPASADDPALPLHQGRHDEDLLLELLRAHLKATGSRRARAVLENWQDSLRHFVKIFVPDYRQALRALREKR